MAEGSKPDERIAPRAPRAAGEAAAPFEGRDESSCTCGGEMEEAAAPCEEAAAPARPDGAEGHAAEAPRAKRAPLSAAQKAGVGVAAALSVALIAVSAYFVAAPAAEGSRAGDLLATTQEAEPSAPADEPAADDPQPAEEPGGADAAATGDAAGAGSSGPAAEAVPSESGAASAGTVSPPSAAPAQPATVTVSVSVDSSAADGRMSGGANPTFEQGATVYDALMACGLSVNASSTPLGIYVSAIGGLAEKEYPGESGWKFSVNGEVIMRACDSVVLQDGDVVRWFYVR